MKTYTTSRNYSDNINSATELITDLGVKGFEFSSCSMTNFGVSVYFSNVDGQKIRVSDHSVTNIDRMNNEIHFEFDRKTTKGIESRFERNVNKFKSFFN